MTPTATPPRPRRKKARPKASAPLKGGGSGAAAMGGNSPRPPRPYSANDPHPARRYIGEAARGRLNVCKWIRLACQRHLADLKAGKARGIHFDEEAAGYALRFYPLLKHSKGEWAGRPLDLEPWQQAGDWILYGWRRADGTRRFRTAFETVARKNGKTTRAAGKGLFALLADNEPGAEVYAAATKRDQAKICWSEAYRMVGSSPFLAKRIQRYKTALVIEAAAAKFEPLGSDADNLDGLNVYFANVDEYHAHKSSDVYDKLDTARGARRSSLLYVITTAGSNRESPCGELQDYCEKVLDGVLQDDSLFAWIFTLDEGDDWRDEAAWPKANPNLGVSVKVDYLRDQLAKAMANPRAQNAFKRYHGNVWTNQVTLWLSMDHWRANRRPIGWEAMEGAECFGGLDLSSKLDLSAYALLFPFEIGGKDRPVIELPPGAEGDPPALKPLLSGYRALARFFLPEGVLEKRVQEDRVPYDTWRDQGWLIATPGEVVDPRVIRAYMLADSRRFNVRRWSYDPWNAATLVSQLIEDGQQLGAPENWMVEVPQSYAQLSEPSKELEALVVSGNLHHDGNPILAWCASNAWVKMDNKGNIMPAKPSVREGARAPQRKRIDGIAAIVDALNGALNSEPDPGPGGIDFW